MKKIVCSVFDSKAKTYCNPFIAVNIGTAVRDFHQAANDPSSSISKYPVDYTLFQIGDFDDETGLISSIPQESLALAIHLKEA